MSLATKTLHYAMGLFVGAAFGLGIYVLSLLVR